MSQRNETNDDKMRKKNFIKLFPARRAFKKKPLTRWRLRIYKHWKSLNGGKMKRKNRTMTKQTRIIM